MEVPRPNRQWTLREACQGAWRSRSCFGPGRAFRSHYSAVTSPGIGDPDAVTMKIFLSVSRIAAFDGAQLAQPRPMHLINVVRRDPLALHGVGRECYHSGTTDLNFFALS
jgi:hypothetical protein